MKEQLDALSAAMFADLGTALSEKGLQELKVRYLGKKGELTAVMKCLGTLSPEERPLAGQAINAIKERFEEEFASRLAGGKEADKLHRLASERIDVTLPGRRNSVGTRHPVTLVMEEVSEIFAGLGFQVAEGPEIELDFYNFEALNFPKDHPARDMQDTFFLEGERLLRTHTSPVQVRTMLRHAPPVRIIAPGTVYRCDSDATHSPMFHQIEGLMVDKGITFGDLAGVIETFTSAYFGPDIHSRLRPAYFPFTEPSAEFEITCTICRGDGCQTCSRTGWIELGGCGMIDPAVFEAVGIDPLEWSGFAFGFGIDRCAQMRHGIADMRSLIENDLRFIRQF